MRFMIRGRREGKTTELVAWALQNPEGVILVTHPATQRYIKQQLQVFFDGKYVGRRNAAEIMIIGRFMEQLCGFPYSTKVCIDDVDNFIQQLVGPYEIDIVTATGELYGNGTSA
jgi:hypothetical protein